MSVGSLEIVLAENTLWIEIREAFLLSTQVAGEVGVKEQCSTSCSCLSCSFLVSVEGKQVTECFYFCCWHKIFLPVEGQTW